MKPTSEIPAPAAGGCPHRMKALEVLLFNLQMNNYGIPVNQIDQILEKGPDETALQHSPVTYKADEILNLNDAGTFFFPSWLKLKSGLGSSLASSILVVEGMSGIIEIPTARIRRLPDLIARHLIRPWIWGAALPEDDLGKDIILLLDFNCPDHSTPMS